MVMIVFPDLLLTLEFSLSSLGMASTESDRVLLMINCSFDSGVDGGTRGTVSAVP